MEFTFSKSRIRWLITLIFTITAIAIAFQNKDLKSKILPLFGTSETTKLEDAAPPALKALAEIYAPEGNQTVWEQNVCLNMTPNGCDLFKFYYSTSIWRSGVTGSDPHFVEIAETLEDGSQVWRTKITINASIQPLFILVEKEQDGQWYLTRILFEEEVKKYEN